ncbi:MAG: AI-2E family transporter [Patescibacteria group bacterium]
MENHLHIEISSGSILRAIALILFFVLLYLLKDILVVLLFAIIIASAVSPFANWLESKKFPRLLSVLMLYLMIFGAVILLVSLVVPFVSSDLVQLTSIFPKIVDKVSSSLDVVQQGSPRYFDFLSEVQNLLDLFSNYLQQISQSAISLLISVFGGMFSFVAIIVISFYLSVMKKGVEAFLESVVPRRYEDYAVDLWQRAETKVGRWLQGQLLLALVVGLVVYVGLSLMGMKFALVFGMLAMLLEIVPVAGPVLAAIPAIFLAFIENPTLGIWVLVFYIVVQQLENHILVPIVLGKTTGLNPVVVIIALLVGANLAGIAGAILSVPLATVLVEVLDDIAKHKEMMHSKA